MNKYAKLINISEGRGLNIIQKPLLTEKSTNLNQFNQYSFRVNINASSLEIKSAIEKIFKVKISKVNTLIIRGKLKKFKSSYGYKSSYKKAIVTLKEGHTIDSSLEVK